MAYKDPAEEFVDSIMGVSFYIEVVFLLLLLKIVSLSLTLPVEW